MTIIVKLQSAHRVCHPLNRIRLTMRVIVHRVNTPLTTRTMMLHVENSIHDWIAQTKVWRTHIDLCAQRAQAIRVFPLFHSLEKIEILFDRTIAVRAVLAGLGQGATILANFVSAEITDEGFSVLN